MLYNIWVISYRFHFRPTVYSKAEGRPRTRERRPRMATLTSFSLCGPNEPCSDQFISSTLTGTLTVGPAVVSTVEGSCPLGAACFVGVYMTTIENTLDPGSMIEICVYAITGDMYGLGVRLGFYLQALSNILAAALLIHGARECRTNSAVLAFGTVVAFVLGLGETSVALEAPVLLALVSILALPLLLQPVLDWKWKEAPSSLSSLLVLMIIYCVAVSSTLWGFFHGWYRGPPQCDIKSGISGASALSTAGRASWLANFILCLVFLGVLFLASVYKTWKARTYTVHPERAWPLRNRMQFSVWFIFTLILCSVCIYSIESTIRRHAITYPGLSKTEYGQWIAFSIGLGAVVSILWSYITRLIKKCGKRTFIGDIPRDLENDTSISENKVCTNGSGNTVRSVNEILQSPMSDSQVGELSRDVSNIIRSNTSIVKNYERAKGLSHRRGSI